MNSDKLCVHQIGGKTLDEKTITDIHNAGARLVIAVTGGGASAISALLTVPGASRSVVEAIVPYDAAALERFLGKAPEQACSLTTARQMAMAAYQRGRELVSDSSARIVGVGCSAALTTDRTRKGTNRCFIATQTADDTRTMSLSLNKGDRTRAGEESLCARTVINAIRRTLGLSELTLALNPGEDLESERVTASPGWRELLDGKTETHWENRIEPGALLPGSFSPFHDGHEQMVGIASQTLNADVVLEISVFNVDKAPLDYVDMAMRLDSIGGRFPVVFTHAPTFLEKARLFPGTTFIVGSDTMERIVSPRYYNNSEEARDHALKEILSLGNRFLVFGRVAESGFIGLAELDLPDALREACTGIPESRFRVDISSTALRAERQQIEDQR